jgi:hypothetical protein
MRRSGWLWVVCPWLLACPGDGAVDPTPATTDATTTTTSTTQTVPTTSDPIPTDTTDTPCDPADCPPGEHCDGVACQPGCDADADCGPDERCDVSTHQCVDCLADPDCDPGQLCTDHTCVAGCSDAVACPGDLACCAGQCTDLATDPEHCGACDPCPALANAAASCTAGACALGPCDDGFADCDGDPANGCESPAACVCVPGEQSSCYTGPPGTAGQGKCLAGVHTCAPDGLGFDACAGEVLPDPLEICGDAVDDDCSGALDDLDADGDGWTCADDCCDAGPACPEPALVNIGAFEYPGNAVDDDCDPTTLDDIATPGCDAALASDSADPLDYARALDLCSFTIDDPPLADKKWGVVSAALTRADGQLAPHPAGHAIRPDFGPNVAPKKNQRMAVLSTGAAADKTDTSPAFTDLQPGLVSGMDSGLPADWLAANGGAIPPTPLCPAITAGTAYDSVMLTLRVRVPTNARSFNMDLKFYSADWPEWACSPATDLFVALLTSQSATTPADGNLAVRVAPDGARYPVSVNLAVVDGGLFDTCFPGPAGCMGTAFQSTCPGGTLDLIGTGHFDNDTGCNGPNDYTGGATSWLRMFGDVEPGETIELRLAIWDTATAQNDSQILLDDLRWSPDPATLGLTK